MNIGIVSDTHKNPDLIIKAMDWMVQRRKISGVYHLGDDYDDALILADYNVEVMQVPGTYDPRYLDNSLPRKLSEQVSGLTITIVHALDKDITPTDRVSSDIILHGHTHRAEILLEDGHLFMNPGHLKSELDKNMPPSFGLLEIQESGVTASLLDMKFGIIKKMEIMRAENGLYKV